METIMSCLVKHFKQLLFLSVFIMPFGAFAQRAENLCAFKNNKMLVAINKNTTESALDSFITKYDLYDLDLKTSLKNNIYDSIKKLGWVIEKNDPFEVVITKSLEAFGKMKSPGELISFMDKNKMDAKINEDPRSNVSFGFNNFYDNVGFLYKDSSITFMMRGNLNATKVCLAGNFNKWKPDDILMQKNDTGWTVNVKLPPGKYYYKFIVDGNWVFDRDNKLYENDVEANTNSVFFVNNVNFKLKGFEKEKKVYVAGSFNNWKPNKLKMIKTADGWQFPAYLANGTYTYKFVVNGKWIIDSTNPNKFQNEFDEFNSVINIGKSTLFKLEGFLDAKKVQLYGSFNDWRRNELIMTKTETGWELPYTLKAGNFDYLYEVDGKQISDSNGTNIKSTNKKYQIILEPNYTFVVKGLQKAKTILISGDFNNWSPDGFAMTKAGDDWIINLHLKPGKRLYKLIVDGKWKTDPSNPQWEQNEYDTGNSFIWFMPN